MIQTIRIDDRLLHGQVAYSWKAALDYQAIVIANDDAATNALRKSALQMAKPDGVKIAIRTVDEAIALLNNDKLKKMRVFVVVSTPIDAEKLINGIDENPLLNIGGVQMKEGRKALDSAVFLNEEELESLDRIASKGTTIEVRLVPNDSAKKYEDLRKK